MHGRASGVVCMHRIACIFASSYLCICASVHLCSFCILAYERFATSPRFSMNTDAHLLTPMRSIALPQQHHPPWLRIHAHDTMHAPMRGNHALFYVMRAHTHTCTHDRALHARAPRAARHTRMRNDTRAAHMQRTSPRRATDTSSHLSANARATVHPCTKLHADAQPCTACMRAQPGIPMRRDDAT